MNERAGIQLLNDLVIEGFTGPCWQSEWQFLWVLFWSQIAIVALLDRYHLEGGRDPNLVGWDY